MALLKQDLPLRVGSYAVGTADEHLADPALLRTVRQRRRQLSRMTIAYDPDTARQRLPDAQYRISRKYDGEFTCLIYQDGELFSLNPGGTLRAGASFHEEAASLLKKAGVKSALIGGELHVRRDDGARTRIHDVVAKARNPKDQSDVDALCFAVFNLYELDGEDYSMHYGRAIEKAQELFKDGDRVFAVETVTGDRKQVFSQLEQWVLNGEDEGIVVRSDSAGVFKIKPRHSLDLAILGFSEGVDDRAGLLHSLLVGIVRDEQHAQVLARVGGGFSDEERASLLTMLKDQVADSDYAEVNSDRVAYQMIRPGPVVEISCLELIARTLHGSPIDRMVLEWNSEAGRWSGVRRLPLASVRSPQFVRLRDDKSFSEDDAGIQRILDIVNIPEAQHGSLDEIALPQSELLERVVATKERKDKTMIRKFLLWKTNKEEASRDFPAYVLHLTDYSPNRKDPLIHDIRVSESEAQIRELLSEWIDEKVVGGWTLEGQADAES